MKRKIELIGHRYNRLVVIGYAPDYVSPRGKHWTNCVCKCDCGATHIARACSLRSGAVKSCGCLSREQAAARQRKHGLAHKDPLYTVWKGMRERCNNPNQTKNSPYYWSRGIRVCAEWDDFMAFRTWALAHGWQRGLQIDRIDPDKGYSPDNCRIVTCKENNNHRNSPRNAKGQYMRKSA
jgi:hypothetical protein